MLLKTGTVLKQQTGTIQDHQLIFNDNDNHNDFDNESYNDNDNDEFPWRELKFKDFF